MKGGTGAAFHRSSAPALDHRPPALCSVFPRIAIQRRLLFFGGWTQPFCFPLRPSLRNHTFMNWGKNVQTPNFNSKINPWTQSTFLNPMNPSNPKMRSSAKKKCPCHTIKMTLRWDRKTSIVKPTETRICRCGHKKTGQVKQFSIATAVFERVS